mgnify:CR=1 FL=1
MAVEPVLGFMAWHSRQNRIWRLVLSPATGLPIGMGDRGAWALRGSRFLAGGAQGPPARGRLTAIPFLDRQGAVAIIGGRGGLAHIDGPITPEAIAPLIGQWGSGSGLDAPRLSTKEARIAPQRFIEVRRGGPGRGAVRSPSSRVGVPGTLSITMGFASRRTRRLARRRGIAIC